LCQAQQLTLQSQSLPAPTSTAIISREANSRIWERTEYQAGPNGQVIPVKHHYTELGTGLCYHQNGQWLDSQEQINILPDGSAAAMNGQHQAYFPANILNGLVTLVGPDGLQLKSQPIGLSYDDGTNTVLVAELTNSVGQLTGQNQVIYTNAFVGVDADLLYTYRKGGFEQDVVLRQQLPVPEQFGLNSANTRLQMLTEFFNPPSPTESVSTFNPSDGLQDTTLSFGAMRMKPGKAFLIGNAVQKPNLKQVPVYKSWIDVNGRDLLVEELPYKRIGAQLSTLPLSSAITANSTRSLLPTVSSKRILPSVHLVQSKSHIRQLAKASAAQRSGVVLDYATLIPSETNFTFKGDTTYYITNDYTLYGKTIFEGGTVIKFNGAGLINIDQNGSIDCQTAPYRPAIFTSQNDDSIAEPIWRISSGTPYYTNVNTFLSLGPTNVAVHDLRFSYATFAITEPNEPNFLNLTNCQFLNVLIPISAYDVYLYNVLIGYSTNETSAINGVNIPELLIDGGLVAENVTSDSGYGFVSAYPGAILALTNCLITRQFLTDSDNGAIWLTNAVVYLPTFSEPVYQVAGGGNYYLATNSPGRGVGTKNIDTNLLAELAQKTTWSPVVYDATNISSLGTLGPTATRDTNGLVIDLGYHYDPVDYAFGGCDLSNSLTFTTGTAVAWFEDNGGVHIWGSTQPYGITLNDGANLSFNGTATQPCIFTRSELVQEGGNGSWGNTGWNLGMVFMGSSQEATVSANFTKWTSTYFQNILQDRGSYGQGFFKNCEFYNNTITTWNVQYLFYTNCLLFRPCVTFWNSPNFTLENCTVYNGAMVMDRSSAVNWFIENSSFDGTGFNGSDSYSGNTNYTTINFNAYNTNNLSWQTYPQNGSYNGTLETIGSNDQTVTNYNWETSWFGSFYSPTNLSIFHNGSANANLLGLDHFTTQTNQAVEGTNIVTIGYHYVATDQYGNPLDSNGNGIADYIEDTNGLGILGPQITLITPTTGSSFTEPATIPILASVSDWSSTVTNVEFLQSNTLQGAVGITGLASSPYNYSWPIVAAGQYSVQGIAQDLSGLAATSSVVNVTVTNLCSY
jgi:hypothetical protein